MMMMMCTLIQPLAKAMAKMTSHLLSLLLSSDAMPTSIFQTRCHQSTFFQAALYIELVNSRFKQSRIVKLKKDRNRNDLHPYFTSIQQQKMKGTFVNSIQIFHKTTTLGSPINDGYILLQSRVESNIKFCWGTTI